QFYYKNMIHGGQIVFKYSDKNVITYFEAIPYIIMHQIDFQFKNNLSHHILKEFSGDKEFFKMIDVFFQSNLNISVPPKNYICTETVCNTGLIDLESVPELISEIFIKP